MVVVPSNTPILGINDYHWRGFLGWAVGQQTVLQARIDSDYIKTNSFVSPCSKQFIYKHTIIMNSNPEFHVCIYPYTFRWHAILYRVIWQSINEKTLSTCQAKDIISAADQACCKSERYWHSWRVEVVGKVEEVSENAPHCLLPARCMGLYGCSPLPSL